MEVERDLHGLCAGSQHGAGKVRPGRRQHDRLVAIARSAARGDLQCVHAADGREEAVRLEWLACPGERRAVDTRHHPGDRLAKIRVAALCRVEGLAGLERQRRGADDEV